MKVFWELEQRTVEWFNLRHGKVTGSRSKGLFVNSDNLLLDLLCEHTEPYNEFEENYISADMLRGIEMEEEAKQKSIEYTGKNFFDCGFIQSEFDLFGISPDGLTQDEKHALEIKCPAVKMHISTCFYNEIPLENIHQLIFYFTCNPLLETLTFVSYRPESIVPMFVRELKRDSIVNIGTKAKPVLKTINEVTEISLIEGKILKEQLHYAIEKLKF
jgi:hypothetical protein